MGSVGSTDMGKGIDPYWSQQAPHRTISKELYMIAPHGGLVDGLTCCGGDYFFAREKE